MSESATVAGIYNYRLIGPDLATSGQPKESQLAAIAAEGYEVIVNLALHDDPRYSLPDEAGAVRALGLEYVHIPVKFDAPTTEDLHAFFKAMEQHQHRRVWVHCAANMRVTAFLGLFRALRQGYSEERAFEPMRRVWQPNAVWSTFIASQLGKANDG
ncbi:MAG: protein tyrosine phosphatase family protein [Burkholderiales bacterium]